MKRTAAAVVFLVCFVVHEPCLAWSAKCLRVINGDCIVVEYEGTREQGKSKERVIFLYGIACPKRSQAFSEQARQLTREMVRAKTVEVQVVDGYCSNLGRGLVALVSVDGKNLSKELVAAGLAWWYEYFAPDADELRQCQETAKSEKKGLWQDPSAIAPWVFRCEEREELASD